MNNQITGHNFFSAHQSRMMINHLFFLSIAKELVSLGCSVYIPTELINFLFIEKDNKHIYFSFKETPYRWCLEYDLDISLGNGSGKTLKTIYDYNTPFTITQIIENLQPNVKNTNVRYLKLFEEIPLDIPKADIVIAYK